MAIAHAGLDHRHPGVLLDRADQTRAAPGNQHIQVVSEGHQLLGGLTAGILHQLDTIGGQAGLFQGVPEHLGHRPVGVQRLLAAPEDHRAAGLDAQGGGVTGDVGTCLIDDAHDPHGHGDLLQLEPIFQHAAGEHSAHRIGGLSHLFHRSAHILDAALGQGQPVQQGLGHARSFSSLQILGVGCQDLLPAAPKGIGGMEQSLLFQSPCRGKNAGGLFGPPSHFGDGHTDASLFLSVTPGTRSQRSPLSSGGTGSSNRCR